MTDRFLECMKFIRRWEGGYVDHPADRGGPTNKGITQKTYDWWRLKKGQTARSVRDITDVEVEEIYRVSYWDTAKCPVIPEPLDLITFDMAVNSGPEKAIRYLQSAIGVETDGVVGPITKAALAKSTPVDAEIFIQMRRDFYRRIIANDPSQVVFRDGWMNRLDALQEVIEA